MPQLSILAIGLLLAGASLAEGPPEPLTVVEVQRLSLPSALDSASDVRFDGAGALVFTARGFGAARAAYDGRALGPLQKLMPEGGTNGVLMAEHCGLSSDFLAVASPINQLLWQSRKDPTIAGALGEWGDHEHAPISFFEDIDMQADRLAILGLMRSPNGMSPDGAIAWIGRLGAKQVELRPVTFSASGKGASPENLCAGTSVGKIRFMADGRLVVIPGAEAGVFLYSAAGTLEQTLDTSALGLALRCNFDEATRLRFGSDVHARLGYLNQFTTVDELLPLDQGPALILRSTGSFGTRWSLAVFDRAGIARTVRLPVTSTSVQVHLRGDARGDRVVLIMREFLPERTHPSELIEYRLEARAAAAKLTAARRGNVN